MDLERRVFLFPGQGSQHPRMCLDLYRFSPDVRRTVDRASELTGIDLPDIVANGDEAELANPEVAQVGVFTLSTAITSLLCSRGFEPWAVAGHSLGEYGALVAAGCLEWEVALEVVARRGRSMARASDKRPGAMAAIIGLPLSAVEELCLQEETQRRVVVANYNAPTQVVVAGDTGLIDRIIDSAQDAGATGAVRLPVGGAFHSPLMSEAENELAPLVGKLPLRPPQRALVSTVTGELVTDIERYRRDLRRQITSPVLWSQTMTRLIELGATSFVEVGPGRVLRGLARSNGQRAKTTNASTVADCDALTENRNDTL
jgi:[acyl-carrier-protein] S-malonyltransferase